MIYGMMRVRNEERWIEKSLRSLLEVCDLVYLFDDHSTDATVEIAQGLGKKKHRRNMVVVIHSPFEDLNESRDKTYLLARITSMYSLKDLSENNQDWVVCIDGDEELVYQDLLQLMFNTSDKEVSYSFQILTLFDSPNQMRVDPPYNNLLRPSMFRLIRPRMVFKSNATHGGGFHCSNVPADIGFGVKTHEPVVKVKHYGYMEKSDRERKYKFYLEHDPRHKDWYWKECFGEPVLAPSPCP